jgi:DNA polymerase-4
VDVTAQANTRSILHVDMDAFFASVECVDDPAVRGKPLLVGGRAGRGVVCAASYEARAFGCRSAMPMSTALRLCPHAVVKPVNFRRYREVSRQVFAIFHRYTPVVEGLSIDEAFLDLTGTRRLLGEPPNVAQRIKSDVRRETGCTCSVGVSYCKFLAKLASDLNKPDGLTLFGTNEVNTVLPTLPVTRIWGIGPKTAARLSSYAIHTIADLLRTDATFLRNRFGDDTQRLLSLARGIDDREVTTDREAKSIGHEQTFGEDLTVPEECRRELLDQTEHVCERLRGAGLVARTVTVKIRTSDFRTVTRSHTLAGATDVTTEAWQAVRDAFDNWARDKFAAVRLLGVSLKELTPRAQRPPEQLDLFEPRENTDRQEKVDATTDLIRRKFGQGAIRRGGV